MTTRNLTCLIGQSDCGRLAGEAVCPKCGMDAGVAYPGQADLEAAQAAALVFYSNEEKRMNQQELVDYEAARGHLDQLMDFVGKWPCGVFFDRATAEIKELRAIHQRFEDEEAKWEDVVKADSHSSYSLYLEAYPEGRFSNEAKAAIYSHRIHSALYFALAVNVVVPFMLIIKFGIRGILGAMLIGLVSSLTAAWVAHEKGRQWWMGAVLGFPLAFGGFVIAMLLPNIKRGFRCDGWKLGRVSKILLRSLCLQFSLFFIPLSQHWLEMTWPGIVFGYLWFNAFTVGMGRLVFGEMIVPDHRWVRNV